MTGISCVLVDDSPAFLAAAVRLLEAEGLSVLGQCRTGQDAVRRAVELAPDLVLVDVELGAEDGFDVARQIAGTPDPPAVIMISSHDRFGLSELSLPEGVSGFLAKERLGAATIGELLG